MIGPKFFPTILIGLDVAASIVYLVSTGDHRKAIYWISAAILTAAVTY